MASAKKQKRINEICEKYNLDYSDPRSKMTVEHILADEFPEEVDLPDTSEFTEYEDSAEESENKYPVLAASLVLIGVFVLGIFFTQSSLEQKNPNYQSFDTFWVLFKYTYFYSYTSCFSVYLLHRLNGYPDDVGSALGRSLWVGFLLSIPVFMIALSFGMWVLFPDYFFILMILLVLGILKLLGVKLFGGALFAGNFENGHQSTTNTTYKSTGSYLLQRFNGTQWITIGRGTQSMLYPRSERELQNDIANNNYKTRYRVVDENGNVQS